MADKNSPIAVQDGAESTGDPPANRTNTDGFHDGRTDVRTHGWTDGRADGLAEVAMPCRTQRSGAGLPRTAVAVKSVYV